MFFFKNVLETGSASVFRYKKGGEGGVTPSPLFYLKTEAEPVSETLFLKKNIGRWIKS
jgi:hypothetical protein